VVLNIENRAEIIDIITKGRASPCGKTICHSKTLYRLSLVWLYGSWIVIDLYNQCLSILKLWVKYFSYIMAVTFIGGGNQSTVINWHYLLWAVPLDATATNWILQDYNIIVCLWWWRQCTTAAFWVLLELLSTHHPTICYSTQRKPQTCRKSLTNLITYKYCIKYKMYTVFTSFRVIPQTEVFSFCSSHTSIYAVAGQRMQVMFHWRHALFTSPTFWKCLHFR
jgi:hypothetical protein